jgi:Omp85 superfamily domain
MRYSWLGCLLFAGALAAGTQDSEFNVNTRYTVEAVKVSGNGWTANFASAQSQDSKISASLGKEIAALVGEKLDPQALDELAHRLKKEFHARTVDHRVLRGQNPEYVQVVFQIQLPPTHFDVSVPKFLYNGKQGFSGAVEGTVSAKQNGFTFGLVSDGDALAERYAGLVARYENAHLGTDRVRLRFEFESYHEQWNGNTLRDLAADPIATSTPAADFTSGAYRTRQNFEPEVVLAVAKPLTVSFGTSFERMEEPYGGPNDMPHTEAANAAIADVHFHERLEGEDDQQDLDADYSLRAATRKLDSDFAYTRHRWEFRYMLTHGKSVFIDDLSTGVITGQAPLFERFVLGNSSTLRGWNKATLDPLGGNRMVHNTVEYRYRLFEVFYDSGAIWDQGEVASIKHSVGAGVREGMFSLAVGFPIRSGHMEPVFILGMNY